MRRKNRSVEQANTVPASETSPAQHKAAAGYVMSKSGLLVPEEGGHVKVTVGNEQQFDLVTDKRRNTRESVEATHRERMEALRAPLTSEEVIAVAGKAYRALKDKHDEMFRKGADETATRDLTGDASAFSRLSQLAKGEVIQRGNDGANKARGMTPRERVADLVSLYSRMRGGTEDEQRYRASMGGDVQIDGTTNEVHYSGYNNGLLYQFARTGQIMDKLDENPQQVRDALASEDPDFSWLTAEPVVVPIPETASV